MVDGVRFMLMSLFYVDVCVDVDVNSGVDIPMWTCGGVGC